MQAFSPYRICPCPQPARCLTLPRIKVFRLPPLLATRIPSKDLRFCCLSQHIFRSLGPQKGTRSGDEHCVYSGSHRPSHCVPVMPGIYLQSSTEPPPFWWTSVKSLPFPWRTVAFCSAHVLMHGSPQDYWKQSDLRGGARKCLFNPFALKSIALPPLINC